MMGKGPKVKVSDVSLLIVPISTHCLLITFCSQTDLKSHAHPERPKTTMTVSALGTHIESSGNEVYDAECMKLINEYFYGVRINPGQDPTHVRRRPFYAEVPHLTHIS